MSNTTEDIIFNAVAEFRQDIRISVQYTLELMDEPFVESITPLELLFVTEDEVHRISLEGTSYQSYLKDYLSSPMYEDTILGICYSDMETRKEIDELNKTFEIYNTSL